MKLMGLKTLTIVLLISLSYSVYKSSVMIRTNLTAILSTAVSPMNGDILVGGPNNTLFHYNSNGAYLDSYNGHRGNVFALFWTHNWCISVDSSGNIVIHDPITLRFKTSLTVNSTIKNADISKYRIALNYGNYIEEYSLNGFTKYANYISNFGGFKNMAYSQNDDGEYLFVLEANYRNRYHVATRLLTTFLGNYNYYFIRTNPYSSYQVLTGKNNLMEEWDSLGYINTYFTNSTLPELAMYSDNGEYVISTNYSNSLLVWKNSQVVEAFDGWKCEIKGLAVNSNIVVAVDACGKVGIMIADNQAQLPVWANILLTLIFLCFCGGSIFLIKRYCCRQGFNNQGYNNQGFDNQGYNNQGFNNQGFNNQEFNNQGYSNQEINNQGYNNQGFNNQSYNNQGFNNQGYNNQGFNHQGFNNQGYNNQRFNNQDYSNQGFDSNNKGWNNSPNTNPYSRN